MGYLGVGGNVWWVQTLVVSSLIRKGLSFILQWRPSISSSSRHPFFPFLIFTLKETDMRQPHGLSFSFLFCMMIMLLEIVFYKW